jgi:ribosome-interacting GTPase 1
MSGQEQLLKKVLDEMQEIKANMATKKNLEDIKVKLDKLSEKMDAHQIENINSDNLLLNEIQALREGVIFVNRKVADAELEINYLKQSKQ